MSMLDRITRVRSGLVQQSSAPADTEQRMSLNQWMSSFSHNGVPYSMLSGVGSTYESAEYDVHSFTQYCEGVYKSNGVVFATVLARMLLFTEARFQWQRMRNGRPGDMFGTPELSILERPWPNGTTGELLARMEQDVSMSGNFYAVREGDRIRRLRPDWVRIILNAPPAYAVTSNVIGYIYTPGGALSNDDTQPEQKIYLPEEVAHWSPIPDPNSLYRGMSWLTPVVNEVMADSAATSHKLQFFKNAATPGLSVSFPESVSRAQFEGFMAAMNASHQGPTNAYKTLYLGGGADVKVIGADLRQIDFKNTQGAGETRICAAGGVPPIIVGLSEGLQSATYSNYGMARRKFGDHWARPQWRSACAALEKLLRLPQGTRLWFDDRDIAFLREDQKDVAEILNKTASTMKMLVDGGWTPDSVVKAMSNEDMTLLEHSGLYSVQLQPPGSVTAPVAPGGPELPPGPGAPEDPPEGDGDEPVAPEDPSEPEASEGRTKGKSKGSAGVKEASDPDGENLHHYWTQDPEGLAKWKNNPHPWTTLYNHLLKHVKDPNFAARLTTTYYVDVFGHGPGGKFKGKGKDKKRSEEADDELRAWDESKHPRGTDGKFIESIGIGTKVKFDGKKWNVIVDTGPHIGLEGSDGKRVVIPREFAHPPDDDAASQSVGLGDVVEFEGKRWVVLVDTGVGVGLEDSDGKRRTTLKVNVKPVKSEPKTQSKGTGKLKHPADGRYQNSVPNTKLTGKDREVILNYAWGGPSFERMNRSLRTGESDGPETEKEIAELTAAISGHQLDKPVMVYRGVRNDLKTRLWLFSGGREGTPIDRGFVSTTTDKSSAELMADPTESGGGLIMIMKLPAGTKAVAIGDQFDAEGGFDQKEILLQRDSRFEIGSTYRKGDLEYVEIKLIEQEEITSERQTIHWGEHRGWDEARHPRKPDGKFGVGSATGLVGRLNNGSGGTAHAEADVISDPGLETTRKAEAKRRIARFDSMSADQQQAIRDGIRAEANKPTRVRVWSRNVSGIADAGRMRTLHELAEDSGKSRSYIQERSAFESGMMDTDAMPDSDKPIYGYVGDADLASGYGDTVITLKASVRERTSVTGGDSLNSLLQPYGIDKTASGGLTDDQIKSSVSLVGMDSLAAGDGIGPSNYMEAQIHGGVSLEDVESIRFPEDAELTDELRGKLESAGIQVEQDEPDPFFGLSDEQLAALGVERK